MQGIARFSTGIKWSDMRILLYRDWFPGLLCRAGQTANREVRGKPARNNLKDARLFNGIAKRKRCTAKAVRGHSDLAATWQRDTNASQYRQVPDQPLDERGWANKREVTQRSTYRETATPFER